MTMNKVHSVAAFLLVFVSCLAGSALARDDGPPEPQHKENGTVATGTMMNGCTNAMLLHDYDCDGVIRQDEYLGFVNSMAELLCVPSRPILDLDLQMVFANIVCLCLEEDHSITQVEDTSVVPCEEEAIPCSAIDTIFPVPVQYVVSFDAGSHDGASYFNATFSGSSPLSGTSFDGYCIDFGNNISVGTTYNGMAHSYKDADAFVGTQIEHPQKMDLVAWAINTYRPGMTYKEDIDGDGDLETYTLSSGTLQRAIWYIVGEDNGELGLGDYDEDWALHISSQAHGHDGYEPPNNGYIPIVLLPDDRTSQHVIVEVTCPQLQPPCVTDTGPANATTQLVNNDCCIGDNAGIVLAGAANTLNRTEDQEAYLHAACLMTQNVLGLGKCQDSNIGTWVPTTAAPTNKCKESHSMPPGPPPTPPPGEDDTNDLLWLLILLLLPCCCWLCTCCYRKETNVKQEDEVAVEVQTIIEEPTKRYDSEDGSLEEMGRRMGAKFNEHDEEYGHRRFGGRGALSNHPPPAGVVLHHIEREKEEAGEYSFPERNIDERKFKREDSGQILDHYAPDGGICDTRRPPKGPVVMHKPKYERKPREPPVYVDPREERKQIGYGDGDVWGALADWEDLQSQPLGMSKMDWVVQSALTVFASAEETGELQEEGSSEEEVSSQDEEAI